MTLAGCQDTPEPAPTPAPLPPAEERLDFHWHEEIDVPAPARAAVDVLHHWVYAHNRWAAEPLTIPDYLHTHSAEDLYRSIYTASVNPRPMAGTVRAFLVEIEIDDDNNDAMITASVCENRLNFHMLDEHGEPIDQDGGLSSSLATLTREEPDGEWIVAERTSHGRHDLRASCEAYAPSPRPTHIPDGPG